METIIVRMAMAAGKKLTGRQRPRPPGGLPFLPRRIWQASHRPGANGNLPLPSSNMPRRFRTKYNHVTGARRENKAFRRIGPPSQEAEEVDAGNFPNRHTLFPLSDFHIPPFLSSVRWELHQQGRALCN